MTDQITSETPPHIVNGADDLAPFHVRVKGLVKIVTITRTSLVLVRDDGIGACVPISEEYAEKLRETFCQGNYPVLPVL